MHYDPIKLRLAKLLRGRFLRRVFHLTLDLLFLRAWYVRRELRRIRIPPLSPPSQAVGEGEATPPREPGGGLPPGRRGGIEGGAFRILDAGMGFGQYSDRMLRTFPGAKLVGLELDRAHLYGCEDYFHRVHPTVRFVMGDVTKLPLATGQFDLILTVDVMEHVEDDVAAFGEYARILKPGGRLMMHTPRDTTSPSIESGGKPAHWTVGEHVRDGYRDDDARQKIEAAGLEIERIVRGYGAPGKIAWTMLQRIPLTMLHWSPLFAPLVVVWLIIALLPALLMMAIDLAPGDRPEGGSLLVVARKP